MNTEYKKIINGRFESMIDEYLQEKNVIAWNKILDSDIALRKALPEDSQALADFMNKYYNRKKTADYFRWQYFSDTQPTELFIATLNDNIIGMCGLQIRQSSVGMCGFGIDYLVDESQRGCGLFSLLEYISFLSSLEHGCAFLATLPNRQGMLVRDNRNGWKTIAKVNQLQIDSGKINDRLPKDLNLSDSSLIHFFKNEKYIDWRFGKNPTYSYERLELDKSNFAMTKIFIDPLTGSVCGDIVDFSIDPEKPEKTGELFNFACKYFNEKNIKTITTWALPHTDLYKILLSMGFEELPQERYFCLRSLDPKLDKLYNINNWQLVQADAEIY